MAGAVEVVVEVVPEADVVGSAGGVTACEPVPVVLGAGGLPTSEVAGVVCPSESLDGTALFDEVAAGLPPPPPSDAQATTRAEVKQSDRSVSDIRMTSLGIASAAWTRQGPKAPPAALRPHGPKTCSVSGDILGWC